MKKLFFGVYNPSIILTYIGVFLSLFGMGMLINYNETFSIHSCHIQMMLLLVAGICDMFDGRIARMCKRTDKEKEFGIQLDSLADTVSFVVFPTMMLMTMGQFSIISVLVSCFYVFAGIMRLGWFNIMTEENKGIFQGVPVTSSAFFIPFVYLIIRILSLSNEILYICMLFLYTLIAFMFIANIHIKKPNAKSVIGLLCFACIVFILLCIF